MSGITSLSAFNANPNTTPTKQLRISTSNGTTQSPMVKSTSNSSSQKNPALSQGMAAGMQANGQNLQQLVASIINIFKMLMSVFSSMGLVSGQDGTSQNSQQGQPQGSQSQTGYAHGTNQQGNQTQNNQTSNNHASNSSQNCKGKHNTNHQQTQQPMPSTSQGSSQEPIDDSNGYGNHGPIKSIEYYPPTPDSDSQYGNNEQNNTRYVNSSRGNSSDYPEENQAYPSGDSNGYNQGRYNPAPRPDRNVGYDNPPPPPQAVPYDEGGNAYAKPTYGRPPQRPVEPDYTSSNEKSNYPPANPRYDDGGNRYERPNREYNPQVTVNVQYNSPNGSESYHQQSEPRPYINDPDSYKEPIQPIKGYAQPQKPAYPPPPPVSVPYDEGGNSYKKSQYNNGYPPSQSACEPTAGYQSLPQEAPVTEYPAVMIDCPRSYPPEPVCRQPFEIPQSGYGKPRSKQNVKQPFNCFQV